MKFKNMMTEGTCLVLSAALLAGCGASASETSSESASSEAVATEETASPEVAEDSYYPVSVDTYTVSSDGATWTPVTTEYTAEPQRVVANNQGTANLLIRLGLADKLVGVAAVYGPAPEDVAEPMPIVPWHKYMISECDCPKDLENNIWIH